MHNVISMGEQTGPHQEPHLGRRLVCTALDDKRPFLPIMSLLKQVWSAGGLHYTGERAHGASPDPSSARGFLADLRPSVSFVSQKFWLGIELRHLGIAPQWS